MKYSGWDYLDHMVQTCEELFECMQGINSSEDLEASVVKRRAALPKYDKRTCDSVLSRFADLTECIYFRYEYLN